MGQFPTTLWSHIDNSHESLIVGHGDRAYLSGHERTPNTKITKKLTLVSGDSKSFEDQEANLQFVLKLFHKAHFNCERARPGHGFCAIPNKDHCLPSRSNEHYHIICNDTNCHILKTYRKQPWEKGYHCKIVVRVNGFGDVKVESIQPNNPVSKAYCSDKEVKRQITDDIESLWVEWDPEWAQEWDPE